MRSISLTFSLDPQDNLIYVNEFQKLATTNNLKYTMNENATDALEVKTGIFQNYGLPKLDFSNF